MLEREITKCKKKGMEKEENVEWKSKKNMTKMESKFGYLESKNNCLIC